MIYLTQPMAVDSSSSAIDHEKWHQEFKNLLNSIRLNVKHHNCVYDFFLLLRKKIPKLKHKFTFSFILPLFLLFGQDCPVVIAKLNPGPNSSQARLTEPPIHGSMHPSQQKRRRVINCLKYLSYFNYCNN